MVKSGDEDQAFAVCSLREGGTESVAVDLALEEYSEFTVVGDAPIHLTGYFMPLDDEDDDGLMPDYGEDDSDFDMDFDDDPSLLGYDESGLPIYDGDGGSSDDDSEDGDSEDDDSGDDSSDDDGPPGGNVAQIKDVTDGASDDSGESGSADSDESDDSKSESESESEEEEEEEEEPPAPQPKKQKAAPPAKKEQPPAKKKQEDVIETKTKAKKYPNGFEIHELKQGKASGKVAKAGKQVTMKYVGRLTNGKVFDQTKGKSTFKFRLGVGEVIKGWDRGVEGMRVGDSRRLVCPPSMAYGSSRTGPIPPNSTLVFEVELVDVR